MLTTKIKCARLTETASVSVLTHGWIKLSKLSKKVDSQQHIPIEEKQKARKMLLQDLSESISNKRKAIV